MRPSLITARCSCGCAPAVGYEIFGRWSVPFGQFRLSHRSKGFSEISEDTVRLRLGPLVGFLQRLAKFFPFLEEGSMRGFVLIEFLGLALALLGADEALQRGFALRDPSLGPADFRLQFAD